MIIALAHAILSLPAQDHLSEMKVMITTEVFDQTDQLNHPDLKHQGNKARGLKRLDNKVRDLNLQDMNHRDLNPQGLKAPGLIHRGAVETQTSEVEVQVRAPLALHHDQVPETISNHYQNTGNKQKWVATPIFYTHINKN